ncbi:uncharacterized protein EI97DRAFT_388221 [Westerdykella ornata]|uniref:lytic cellulose monooxygenase (C4-dehydrogenating) n=1 Tax=Westerdykella ornata TaxID=318751 RepID=A0A6A6J4Y1_WESOR|nr:uncharacterized protein EI97DRAFT_388221 [Westerdykella ornata]KAF2271294.1 hypothetical protein EI97DRAFT_388221 [Westerdykella ornata]
MTVGPEGSSIIGHPGPGMFYLAKAPEGVDLNDWDGDGDWFKIRELGPVKEAKATWEVAPGSNSMNVTIPQTVPPGKYLLRTEHLYLKSGIGQTDYYVSCTHLEIEGPGGGTPGPTVKFPGAYDNWDISIWPPFRIKWETDLSGYKAPGPDVWTG